MIKRGESTWQFRQTKLFYQSNHSHSTDFNNLETEYDLIMGQAAIVLFRINGGKAGFYLASLGDKQYYYCGLDFADAKTTLLSLGIGRPEPN